MEGLPPIPDVAAEGFPSAVKDTAERRIRAVNENPLDPWANGDLAMILHAHEQLGAAETLYRRAQALSGGAFRWTYLLGVALQDGGSNEAATESFRRALAKRRYVPAEIRLGETLAAGQSLDEAAEALRQIDASGENQAAAAYGLGSVLLDRGDAGEAVSSLERAVALAPDSGAARYALGTALRVAGRHSEAERMLRTVGVAEDTKPALDDPVLERVRQLAADEHHFLNLGRSLEANGHLADALRAYERAIAINPRMATAHANLVGAHGQMGNIAKAELHYEAARAINPEIEELHNNWGVLQATQSNPEAAAAAFRRALEVNPGSAKAHANLGVALSELGDHQEAARHFQEAVAGDPTNRPARMNLGTAALAAGRPAEAAEHLEAALLGGEDGSGPFIRYTLAHAYFAIGRDAEGKRSVDEALRTAVEDGLSDLAAQIRQDKETHTH